jgi:hypothetical protein
MSDQLSQFLFTPHTSDILCLSSQEALFSRSNTVQIEGVWRLWSDYVAIMWRLEVLADAHLCSSPIFAEDRYISWELRSYVRLVSEE